MTFHLSLLAVFLPVIVIGLILAFEVWMFVQAIRNRYLTDAERALWAVGMLVLHPFVAIAYYFVEYPKQRR